MRVAIVTWSELLELSADDQLLRAALQRRGIETDAVSWDDDSADWQCYDAAILRSTWDYHRRPVEFEAWLDRMESAAVPLWNPASLVRRNLHKKYLLDLAAAGVPIVPTALVSPGDGDSVAEVMARHGWSRAVVKPAISASGFGTYVVYSTTALRGATTELRGSDCDLLVQPFVEQVVAEGELSFVFIDGTWSHALIKRAARGDFRVQSNWGGTASRIEPSRHLVEQAEAIAGTIDGPWLYARVDAVEIDGQLVLMELELAEPSLFFNLAPEAVERMAVAIEKRWARAAA